MSGVETPLHLKTPVEQFPGVNRSRAIKLREMGIRIAQDLAFLFPRDYEFPAPPASVDRLVDGEPASLVGEVTEAEIRSRNAGKSIFGALVENESGAIRILFFNQSFRAQTLTVGTRVMISGAPRLSGLRFEFTHPKVVILGADEELPEPRPLPIYSLREGLRLTDMRRFAELVVPAVAAELKEVLPESIRATAAEALRGDGYEFAGDLPGISTAIKQIHFPDNTAAMTAARLRFVFQELFVMQLALALRRRQLTTDLKAPPIEISPVNDAQIIDRFGFELTADQRTAMQDIRRDLRRQFPMNRMLQGDVGSGKTAVAAYAMLAAAAAGYQSILMAPTEVLARQHERSFQELTEGSRVRIGLLCGSLSAGQRRQVLKDVAAGEIDLLIGTQALVYGDIQFANLGLCVIDEQHKFGVGQRIALRGGGVDPHYLVMSATPIPRSVAMTMFGDVDLSTIREKPPGRGEVNTYLVTDELRERWWKFVRQSIAEGRQAFVVAPRVDDNVGSEADAEDDDVRGDRGCDEASEPIDAPEQVSSVYAVMAELSEGPLSGCRMEVLHGRLPADQKQRLMTSFADGEIDVLVSTTVIEVGINVPNATVMTILGAQRFGLAQLHQLRGRVSRGFHAGHVAVFTDGKFDPADSERLAIFEKTLDGFELAEADFRIRGPGDLLGRAQSGLPPLHVADLTRDEKVIATARRIAQQLVDEDPHLESKELAGLKDQVMRRYQERLSLGDVA